LVEEVAAEVAVDLAVADLEAVDPEAVEVEAVEGVVEARAWVWPRRCN